MQALILCPCSAFFSAQLYCCLCVYLFLSVCTKTLRAILVQWFYFIEKMALGFRTEVVAWIRVGSKC